MLFSRYLPIDIGMRYLQSNQSSLRFVTRITTIGLILAIAVLLLFQAVMSGFQKSLEDRIVSIVPHFRLIATDANIDTSIAETIVHDIGDVVAWGAVAEGTVLLVRDTKMIGIELYGVDPVQYQQISDVHKYVTENGFANLSSGEFNIVLGDQVAARLKVVVGDVLTVVFPTASFTPLGVFPRQKTFTVSGLLNSESILDNGIGFAHIEDAAKMLRIQGSANSIHFKTSDPFNAQLLALNAWSYVDASDVFAVSWRWVWGKYYDILRNIKNIFFLIMSLLVAVAAFNLVSTLVIFVHERRSDIAILRTMGGNTALVTVTFVFTSMVIAGIGIVVGTATAWVFGIFLEWFFPILTQVLGMNLLSEFIFHTFTVDFNLEDLVRVLALSVTLAVLAALYPAWRATRMNPAEILQRE